MRYYPLKLQVNNETDFISISNFIKIDYDGVNTLTIKPTHLPFIYKIGDTLSISSITIYSINKSTNEISTTPINQVLTEDNFDRLQVDGYTILDTDNNELVISFAKQIIINKDQITSLDFDTNDYYVLLNYKIIGDICRTDLFDKTQTFNIFDTTNEYEYYKSIIQQQKINDTEMDLENKNVNFIYDTQKITKLYFDTDNLIKELNLFLLDENKNNSLEFLIEKIIDNLLVQDKSYSLINSDNTQSFTMDTSSYTSSDLTTYLSSNNTIWTSQKIVDYVNTDINDKMRTSKTYIFKYNITIPKGYMGIKIQKEKLNLVPDKIPGIQYTDDIDLKDFIVLVSIDNNINYHISTQRTSNNLYIYLDTDEYLQNIQNISVNLILIYYDNDNTQNIDVSDTTILTSTQLNNELNLL